MNYSYTQSTCSKELFYIGALYYVVLYPQLYKTIFSIEIYCTAENDDK